ncbi:MAG: outer membrane protein assembly factor BamD [Candidatus Delongbacteria bacterium]|nr:outer membrane protein assembly factor BamD [Candidatus Delongbacteria bacterium]
MRFAAVLSIVLILAACAGLRPQPDQTLRGRYQEARQLYERDKFLDAAESFDVLALSFSGSELMDSIKFYYAECRFELREFILAANSYSFIVEQLPNSHLRDLAQFKLGQCYYLLAPKYPLDQTYTYQAIRAFNDFLKEFPTSEYCPEVEDYLYRSRMKLARKEYRNGELYFRMKRFKAALIYLDDVLREYYDIEEVAATAVFLKAECLRELDREQDARALYENYLIQYPQGTKAEDARKRLLALDRG